MPRRLGLLALTAASAALLAPAAHAEPVFAGFTCGFVAGNDGTGQVVQDPNVHTGVIFDYFYVGDTTSGPATSVTITCSVQINDARNNGVGGTSRTSTVAGPGGILVDTITFTTAPGDDVYVCTRIEAQTAGGTFVLASDDDDDPSNGNQCALTTTAEGGGQEAEAEPWDREAGTGNNT